MIKSLLTCCLVFFLSTSHAEQVIQEVEFNDVTIRDVVRTLSEITQSNIIATPDASSKKVSIRLKNVLLLDAIKSVCRINDLWYRFDEDTHTYRLMTREEFGKDLIVGESERIEVFKLLNANVQIVAQAIEDLYGNRVVLSLGIEAGQSMSSSNGSNSSSSRNGVRNSRSTSSRNRSSGGSRSSSNSQGMTVNEDTKIDIDELSIDQIANLTSAMTGTTIDPEKLLQFTSQAQPIYVTVNNEHNMILVRTDDGKVIDSIGTLVKKMDIPIPQVMLEMKILSIILGEDFNSIFNFNVNPSGNNQSTQPIQLGNNALLGTGTFIYEFLNSRLQANIEFLQQNNRVNVLSNPMVLASNHREAELFIGEETLLTEGFTYFQPSVIGNSNFVQPGYIEADIVREDIGITLRITPRINTDETVTLELEQESSTVNVGGGTIPVSDSNGGVMNLAVDTVNTSRLTGTVVAHNNLTVAVGGLIRTSKSTQQRKVPILGEIPVLGRIFRSDIESEEDTETVLLITPRILNKANESENIRKTDNRFYQDLNRGHPETQPAPNKFIDKAKPNTVTNQSQSNSNMTRQNVYLSMSQYAAETVRIPEIERVKSATYSPVRVSSEPVSFIFDDNAIMAKPIASWQRGGMYVTAIQVLNNSQQSKAVPYQSIKGKWLASSIEQNNLAPYGQNNDRTFLYLVSALSFEESINYAQ